MFFLVYRYDDNKYEVVFRNQQTLDTQLNKVKPDVDPLVAIHNMFDHILKNREYYGNIDKAFNSAPKESDTIIIVTLVWWVIIAMFVYAILKGYIS